ncbi:MAG: metal ABC transporter permease [Clostridia bacterium]|nr:metal ABC transporter permease [Clostridia bacterium]
MTEFFSMFGYSFMQRALIAGIAVSLCAALLGVSLVLRRYAMIGDGLSHVAFGAVSVATALHLSPLWVAVPVVMLTAVLLLSARENNHTRGDASVAMLSTASLAIGVLAMAGKNTDVYSYMFGSILAVRAEEMWLCLLLGAAVLVFFLLFRDRILSLTFDEGFARATGQRIGGIRLALAIFTAVTIVLGMRLMGTLLISALVLFPAMSAMQICRRFGSVLCAAGIISVLCFIAGLCISYQFDLAPGATVVAANLTVYTILRLVRR